MNTESNKCQGAPGTLIRSLGTRDVAFLQWLGDHRYRATTLLFLLLLGGAGIGGLITLLPLGLSASGVQWNLVAPPYPAITLLMAVILAATLILARTSARDVSLLAEIDPAVIDHALLARPARWYLPAATLLILIAFQATFLGLYIASWRLAGVEGFGLYGAFRVTLLAGSTITFFHWALIPILSFLGGCCLTTLVMIAINLNNVAVRIHLSIHRAAAYSAISNTIVRTFVALMVMLTLFPITVLLAGTERLSLPVIGLLNLVLILLMLIPISLSFLPVLKLRNRLRQAIQQEMDETLVALDRLEASSGQPEQSTAQSQDTLRQRQRYLESRSDWPITENIKRIVIFGLLPPIAWVLAAVVENTLYQ